MKKFKKNAVIAGSALLAFLILPHAQNSDPFYVSSFDGAWAGSIRMSTAAGPREFPLVVNLNHQGVTGIGFALLPEDLTLAPENVAFFPLVDFTQTGKKITLKTEYTPIQTGESEPEVISHTLILKYKAAKDFLKGNFKTTDPALGKGKIFLYRQSEARMAQKVWQGMVKKDGVNTAFFLQLIQKDPIEPAGSSVSALTGFGFLGEDYGKFTVGSFDGMDILGVLNLSGEAVSIALSRVKHSFKGNVLGSTFSSSVTLQPAGTNGNDLAVTKAAPSKLLLGRGNAVTLNGRNMGPGTVVHLDSSDVQITAIENTNKKRLTIGLQPDISLPDGLKIALRVTGMDGQSDEIFEAFETETEGAEDSISFINDVQPVFTASCALSGCHSGASPSQGLDLSSNAHSRIVNVSSKQRSNLFLIKPLDTDNSYLLRKIKGDDITGSRMPLGRAPLTMEVISLIENWIRQGALNN